MKNSKDIHVLVIPSWYPPHGGHFFREHSQTLAAEGLNTGVIACHYKSLKHMSGRDVLKTMPAEKQYINGVTEWHQDLPALPLLMKANMHRWVNRSMHLFETYTSTHGQPDIIQAHSSLWAGYAAALIHKKHGIPYVVTEHRGRFIRQGGQTHPWIKQWHLPYLREAFRQAAAIVCVSEAMQTGISALFPEVETNIILIPNQVDTDFFTPAPLKPDMPPFQLFALAHLTAEKGMDTLIKAMQLLQQQPDCSCRLRIGGEGKERKRLEQMTRDAGLTSFIHFTGRLTQEEVRKEMQQAHAFVHPSRMESFGIVLLEAMACGLPVIATRSGGPEQIIKAELGLLCERDNAQALADCIIHLMSHYQAYHAANIRAHIINHYGTKVISRQYTGIYKQILSP